MEEQVRLEELSEYVDHSVKYLTYLDRYMRGGPFRKKIKEAVGKRELLPVREVQQKRNIIQVEKEAFQQLLEKATKVKEQLTPKQQTQLSWVVRQYELLPDRYERMENQLAHNNKLLYNK